MVHERLSYLNEKVLSVTFNVELQFSVPWFFKLFGLGKFNTRCSVS